MTKTRSALATTETADCASEAGRVVAGSKRREGAAAWRENTAEASKAGMSARGGERVTETGTRGEAEAAAEITTETAHPLPSDP